MRFSSALVLLPPFVLVIAKLLLKYYAWYKSRGSLEFRRNPRLIVAYLTQLEDGSQHTELASEHSLPPLLVRGEDRALVQTQPHGYGLKWILNQADRTRMNNSGLVTIDKIWQLKDGIFPRSSTKQLKDLCLSFSLFKLLRCRFARQAIIAEGQVYCYMAFNYHHLIWYGSEKFDRAAMILFSALVVLSEMREIASYICSNWTKVALICHYVSHASWQQSPLKKKLLGCLLCCRLKILKHWDDRTNQCSLLMLRPRGTPGALRRRLIPLLDKKKLPTAVKAAVLKSLRIHRGIRSNGVESLCRRLHLQAGHNPLSEANGVKGTADAMLVCHIATSILEVRSAPGQPDSDDKIAATHLSRYSAYLVAHAPALLPEDDEWCKSLYTAVQKEAKRALAAAGGVREASTPEAEYQRVVQALMGAGSDQHYVLKNGAELGKKLVELAATEVEEVAAEGEDAVAGGEEAAWEILADFWSEIILYAAPSDNVDAHAEAVARGGELITLLWALLTHLGVLSRPDAAGSAGADGVV